MTLTPLISARLDLRPRVFRGCCIYRSCVALELCRNAGIAGSHFSEGAPHLRHQDKLQMKKREQELSHSKTDKYLGRICSGDSGSQGKRWLRPAWAATNDEKVSEDKEPG